MKITKVAKPSIAQPNDWRITMTQNKEGLNVLFWLTSPDQLQEIRERLSQLADEFSDYSYAHRVKETYSPKATISLAPVTPFKGDEPDAA